MSAHSVLMHGGSCGSMVIIHGGSCCHMASGGHYSFMHGGSCGSMAWWFAMTWWFMITCQRFEHHGGCQFPVSIPSWFKFIHVIHIKSQSFSVFFLLAASVWADMVYVFLRFGCWLILVGMYFCY